MSVRNRVELELHELVRQPRELGEFVHFCIERIEQDLGRADSWTVKIVPDRVCYGCDVVVQHGETIVRANGNGFDGAVAGREAFRKIEDLLREQQVAFEVACAGC
jgi:hypothetical protein